MREKLENNFIKADSTNLPKVDSFMVYDFLVKDERYNDPEVRGVKLSASGRETYGDNAIGYVCIHRNDNICVIKARITPEHRVRNSNYHVQILIDEQVSTVKDVSCNDCAASQGGCKHGIAFLFWLHRKTESPSPTEVECYWKKPRLSGVGTSEKFIKATDLYKIKEPVIKAYDASNFLSDTVKQAKGKELDSQFTRYFFQVPQRNVYNLSMHTMILDFFENKEYVTHSVDEFLSHLKSFVTAKLCLEAEQATRDQSTSLLWFELRYARITASRLYEAAHCSVCNGSLVKQILGVSKKYDNVLMQRGRNLEKEVIKTVQKQLKINILKSGFFINTDFPFLGASPDGITKDFVVEVKCPTTEKNTQNYISDGKLKDKYKAQIMFQMYSTGRQKGLFCVADPNFEKNKSVKLLWIDYEHDFLIPFLESAALFWKKNIFDKLASTAK